MALCFQLNIFDLFLTDILALPRKKEYLYHQIKNWKDHENNPHPKG
ncbi:hypothetical protein M113_4123 [Bacteroides fragilis str. 3986 N3]|uniref:Uncharacterized protein n=1 Tax=Bacteroides fragilis str. 3783N1-6 TaxID=1339310 RepID=A0AB73AGV3_BACFG|nr:hypothetical protein M117_4019 [Bacteroides fragilis str. 3774 T13]EXY44627.1 hypothetical protein M118_3864 [Bacteroides fragilis str. 3783N1-2]EXY49424.1 hypothetical protein M121_3837 [Bacteroides fragilis str. 3783N2-1]EXY54163.1 hypothetical protein M122_3811 [Bacteroides fragilis str. 3976T7]EXY58681.1 hypothetical protein M111_3784 [Bacteroides fragilis str. 3986T(B)10]EXZ03553.1 hypothetical protein M072_4051 [Bacteroides fragilis str. DS-208]EYA50798.1 hypothetical protein M114_41